MKKLLVIAIFLLLATVQNSFANSWGNVFNSAKKSADKQIVENTTSECSKITETRNMYDACCMMPRFDSKRKYNEHAFQGRSKVVLNSLMNAKNHCGTNLIDSCVKQFLKEKKDIDYRC